MIAIPHQTPYWPQPSPTPSADPIYLYADTLIGILPERGINNGQPSLHAVLFAKAQIKDGETRADISRGPLIVAAATNARRAPWGRSGKLRRDGTVKYLHGVYACEFW